MQDSRFCVLIVEDSATIRYAYKRLLEGDYTLVFAEDPLTALKQVAAVRPDAVLLDINLKDHARGAGSGAAGAGSEGEAQPRQPAKRMDGLNVCDMIKRSPFKDTPVIMLTSKDGFIDKMRGKMAHADKYLTKPVDQDVLRSTLREVLSEKAVARRLKGSPYVERVYGETAPAPEA